VTRKLLVHALGRVEYEDGLSLMRIAADAVRAGRPPETDHLFLVEHPPVVTLGRGAGRTNIIASPAWLEKQGFEIHETDRGGDVTYHGPGQVVGYPIEAGRHDEHHGAWVRHRKIGAVGVHLSRWISSHGFAFNHTTDLEHFQAIVPCGIADPRLGVTSLEAELRTAGRAVPERSNVEDSLATHLAEALGRIRADARFDLRTISVVAVDPDDRVLLLRRSAARGGFWQQVTGRIEPGEEPRQAARRELEEETGANVPVEPLGYHHAFVLDPSVNRVKPGDVVTVEETAFAARVPRGFVARLSAEHAEQAWVTPDEAAARVRFSGLRKAVRLAVGRGAARAATVPTVR
jgi:lipoyl(octanoyl) transferase